MPKVTTRIQVVSPAQAKEWLSEEINQKNRNPSRHTVDGYAAEMRAGRWVLTGDAIMFNTAGHLINGQHRLNAVVQYGKGCEFLVMENVDDGAREVMDQGRARSVPDMMNMLHGIGRAPMVTGAIRIIDDFIFDQRFKLSVGHALEMASLYHEGFKWAVAELPGKSAFTKSPIVAALVYAYKTAPSSVEAFARRLCGGADLPQTSAILHLRDHVYKKGTLIYREEKREVFLLTLHAIYKVMNNEPVRSLKVRADIVDKFSPVYTSVAAKKKVA